MLNGVKSHLLGKKSIEEWEIGVAKNVVNEFMERCEETRFEFDDLYQECLLRWYEKRNKCQKNRGAKRQTFMCSILRKKLKNILRDNKKTNKRKIIFNTIPLEQLIVSKYSKDEDESNKTYGSILEDITNEENEILLKNDLEKVIQRYA